MPSFAETAYRAYWTTMAIKDEKPLPFLDLTDNQRQAWDQAAKAVVNQSYGETSPRDAILELIVRLEERGKANLTGENARKWAIAMTEAEKLYAWIVTYL